MADPRILIFDIETLPNLRKALKYWVKLSQWPGKTLRASVSSICVICWKVLGDDKINTLALWDFPEWAENVNDDRPLIQAFAKIVNEADCVVTHNGKGFDWRHLQTRLLLSGHDLLDDKVNHVDTKQISSRKFFFIDNKLQTLAEELFGASKLEHEGWDLWVKTHDRDPAAMTKMAEYCAQDVAILERVYRKLRPVAPAAPNHNLFSPYKEKVCPKCGSSRIHKNGKRTTGTKVYIRYRCTDCGASSRSDLKDELLR